MNKSATEPKTRKVNLGSAIVVSGITLVIGILIGTQWDHVAKNFLPYLSTGKISVSSDTPNWTALDEVYDTLSLYYDGDIDKQAIIDGAKAGLVASLGDKYTVYMTANESTEFQDSLHGEAGSGIGVVIGERDSYVRIIRTLPDNPARRAGLLAGDILYRVGDELVYELSADDIATKLRGEAGSEVKLTVVRDDKELDFTLKRESINNVSADLTYLDTDNNGKNDTAYILTSRFDNDTGSIIRKFAESFNKDGIKKVILDLRDNGGGYTTAAKSLLSLWIDGEVVYTQKTSGRSEHFYADRGQAILSNMPTVVLVNANTASASEIVAGALQDYNKATLIGTTTYGKGVVQSLVPLSNQTMLKVTSAHWYTPKDKCIDKTGIEPDQKVERSFDDINSNKDPQLDAAKRLDVTKSSS